MANFFINILSPMQIREVAEFLHLQGAAQLSETEWLEKMNLFWDSNPHFNPDVHPRGWVITGECGAVRGFLGNIPVKYCNQGKEESNFWATSWYVDPCARKMSISLYRKFLEQDGVLFNTTPTPLVEKIIAKRFHFTPLEQRWLKFDFLMPLTLRGTIAIFKQKFRGSRPLSIISCVAGGLAYFISLFFYLMSSIKGTEDIMLVDQKTIPLEYDDWWSRRKTCPSYFLARDRKTLEWLCFSKELENKRKLIAVYKKSRFIGTVLLKLVNTQENISVELVDLELLDESHNTRMQIFHQLRSSILRWSSEATYFRAYAMFPGDRKALYLTGFFKISGRNRFYYLDRYNSTNNNICNFSAIDGDRCLFP